MTPAKTIRRAIRSLYGKASRYLTAVPVATDSENLNVCLFDAPGPIRIYAWFSSGKVMVVRHGGEITSPKSAVLHAGAREISA
jgi:hypothetical protein